MGEGLGAVDGIDDPPATGGAELLGLLLAEDPVVGMALLELLAQQPLGALVGAVTGVPSPFCSIARSALRK